MGTLYSMGSGLVTFPSPLLSAELGLGAWCGAASSSDAQRHLTGMEESAPESVGAGSTSHAQHGDGHKGVILPPAVGVGRGQFRQPADSGRLLHHAPVPQLLLRESLLRQTP